SSKILYPAKELHILTEDEEGGGADFRMSITEIISLDSIAIYKVRSTYKGSDIGFEFEMPRFSASKKPLIFKSNGRISDTFLVVLSKIYNIKTTSNNFTQSTTASFIDMNDFAKKELGQEISGTPGVKELKLFFESEAPNNYAELFLNINE